MRIDSTSIGPASIPGGDDRGARIGNSMDLTTPTTSISSNGTCAPRGTYRCTAALSDESSFLALPFIRGGSRTRISIPT